MNDKTIKLTLGELRQWIRENLTKLPGADIIGEDEIEEVAPEGWEGTVKAMKKHKEIDNPWALAWSMRNKGEKSHKK